MKNSLKPLLLIFFMGCCSVSFAQWNDDTLTGGKLVIKDQYFTSLRPTFTISDGAGGTIQVFKKVNGSVFPWVYSIHLQHMDSAGILRWGTPDSGTVLIQSNNTADLPNLFDVKSDNTKGAYILYAAPNKIDNPDSFYLCIQHIDSSGIPLWPSPGKVVTGDYAYKPVNGYFNAKLCSVTGGIGVLWRNNDNIRYGQLYAQKVTTDGNLSWNTGGVAVCIADGLRGEYYCVSDGAGGMFAVFEDGRNGIYNDSTSKYNKLEIFAQHISNTGINTFGDEGMPATGNAGDSMVLMEENEITKLMVPDDLGGCYFVYGKYNGASVGGVYLQRLDGAGQRLWGNYGSLVKATSDSDFIFYYKLYQNPSGDGVASVYSTNGGSQTWNRHHLFLQFHNTAGMPLFSPAKKVGVAADRPDDRGEYAFDASFDTGGNTNLFFYGTDLQHSPRFQIIRADGTLMWDTAGKAIVYQYASRVQVLPGNNGYILLQWFDNRDQSNFDQYIRDVFISRVDGNGNISSSRRTIVSITNGDWNNPATWEGGVVPGPGNIVIVKNTVTVSADASCYALTIDRSGGSITILSGISFSVLH